MVMKEAPMLSYKGPQDHVFKFTRYMDQVSKEDAADDPGLKVGSILNQMLRFYVDDELHSEHEIGAHYQRVQIKVALEQEVAYWREHNLDEQEVEAALNDLESKILDPS